MLLLLLVFVNYHMNIEIQQREIILFQILEEEWGIWLQTMLFSCLVKTCLPFQKSISLLQLQLWFHCHHFPRKNKIKRHRKYIYFATTSNINSEDSEDCEQNSIKRFPLCLPIQCRFLVVTIRSECFMLSLIF